MNEWFLAKGLTKVKEASFIQKASYIKTFLDFILLMILENRSPL